MLPYAPPAPDLQDCVAQCWSFSGTPDGQRSWYELNPDASGKLIFRFSAHSQRLVYLGPIAERTTVEIDYRADYFGFRFHPGQSLHWPQQQHVHQANTMIELQTFGGESLESLALRLLQTADHRARQVLMEDLLRTHLPAKQIPPYPRAARLCHHRQGQATIRALAQELGMHVRSLERLFQQQAGIGPKKMNRLIRLRRAIDQLRTHSTLSLGELAHHCGYCDQSHMIREFKELTGRLPSDPENSHPQPLQTAPRTRIIHRFRP